MPTLLTQPAVNTHASTNVQTPIFRRHIRKDSNTFSTVYRSVQTDNWAYRLFVQIRQDRGSFDLKHLSVTRLQFSARNCSISLTLEGDNRHEAAPINWLSCPGFLAPTIAAVTDGCRNVQAIATSPGDLPC